MYMEIRHLSFFRQLGIGKTKDQKRIPHHQYLEDISLKFRQTLIKLLFLKLYHHQCQFSLLSPFFFTSKY